LTPPGTAHTGRRLISPPDNDRGRCSDVGDGGHALFENYRAMAIANPRCRFPNVADL
jgi:hypothetical protein